MLVYNPSFVIAIVILFILLTAVAMASIFGHRGKLRRNIVTTLYPDDCPINYFPKFVASRSIMCYVVTLMIVSALFFTHVLPFQFMLFGFVAVVVFFEYSNRFTMRWKEYAPQIFTKKLFLTALLIRVAYMTFIYFYYIQMTGSPNAYYAGDEFFYESMAVGLCQDGFDMFVSDLLEDVALSDSGYCWWLGIEYQVLGMNLYMVRLVKCLMDTFSCLLIYNLAERNFGESTARIAAVFYMLMPNMWYYCGVSLKECEMAFLTLFFVERGDLVLHSTKIRIKDMILPLLIIIIMFTFRTALASVMFAAFAGALILSSGKQLPAWQKVVYGTIFGIWMFLTVGAEIVQETEQLWAGRTENQESGYQWRAERAGGNSFAKYASASVFAPLIFTIPFSSMVYVYGQENQMMMNGANFIKNIMSGFTIFAMFLLLFRGNWRQHVLPIAVTCGYLVVLVFSNFAHSERFHFPILGLELMFAAYGVTQMTNRHKRWFNIWSVGVCVANVLWALIKLRGRGLA